MDEHTFMVSRQRAVDYLNSLEKVFVKDQFLNWDPENRIKIRIVSARAYHSLSCTTCKCIRPTPEELEDFGTPDFIIYNAGQFPCNRYTHYMASSTSIDVNLARKEMVILSTQYAGEMKKGLFSVMHYLMPKRQILSLHSGCNMGKDRDVALFFGLSGTGKTTLSTDHNRYLIGDDEHCWSENGVSNIEGGCYAKCIDLLREKEPDIWNATKFGIVLENVVFDEHTREVEYSDEFVTGGWNLRWDQGANGDIFSPFWSCMHHAASHKVCGHVGREDAEAWRHSLACEHWLVWWKTWFSSCTYGSGSRIKLKYTRNIIDAIHSGSLLNANYKTTEIFGLEIPTEVDGVPSEILDPVNTLAGLFKKNFEVFASYKIGSDSKLTDEILAAGQIF
ncbi:Phosphoenolpyruvate carboxykinase (ATP) 1-like protein [Drosera capensis]